MKAFLTFQTHLMKLGRRQLATEIFLWVTIMQKCGRQKLLIIFFSSQQNTNRWKTLVANFSFKNQKEENMYEATMAIFPLTNKIKYKKTHWLFIHLPLKNHVQQIEYWPYTQFRVTALNVSSQFYTLSCARLKNCCLVFCSMFKMIYNIPIC